MLTVNRGHFAQFTTFRLFLTKIYLMSIDPKFRETVSTSTLERYISKMYLSHSGK
jgi:hypothetical protein